MRGVDTPIEVELEFRKHYLVTGNAAASARAVGLPPTTGQDLAKRAYADSEFVAARAELRARLLPDAEQMATAAMQICLERLNKEPPDVERLASLGAQKVSFQDPGPQYAASLAKLHQSVVGSRRFDAEKSGEIASDRDVTIRVLPTEKPETP